MIAYIKGTIEQVTDQSVILDNQGIGYIINASSATLSRLPRKGDMTQLYTYHQVNTDGMSLFGFLTREELQMFRLLILISGVGSKIAVAILGTLSPEQIITAVVSQDPEAFSKTPGVGKKVAQRITLELQDKIKAQDWGTNTSLEISGAQSATSSEKQDAIDALLSLGYGKSDSVRAVLAVAEEDMATDQIIRLALKKLM
ncbi:MAG: Holliday junction branch migration protein RuvA [Defluviitaleaceae bacterium]|nr:Holliday junction branch migration protein RuvA [Defluviitaleaceae bacterium]